MRSFVLVLALVITAGSVEACASTSLPASAQSFLETKRGAYTCPFGQAAGGRFIASAGSLRLRSLAGQTVRRAEAEIRQHGCIFRILIDNGREAVRANDLLGYRVNLDVANGRVVVAVAF
jgi:hypothetical protein